VGDRVEVRVGAALDSLPGLEDEEPFDFVFIDADKVNNPNYFEWAVKLTHPGAVIVVDNVVRGGSIASDSAEPNVAGTRALYDKVSADKRVTATAVQTVGSKGYDGFLIARVN
jgi:predicted O-methyltransferase YrrM